MTIPTIAIKTGTKIAVPCDKIAGTVMRATRPTRMAVAPTEAPGCAVGASEVVIEAISTEPILSKIPLRP